MPGQRNLWPPSSRTFAQGARVDPWTGPVVRSCTLTFAGLPNRSVMPIVGDARRPTSARQSPLASSPPSTGDASERTKAISSQIWPSERTALNDGIAEQNGVLRPPVAMRQNKYASSRRVSVRSAGGGFVGPSGPLPRPSAPWQNAQRTPNVFAPAANVGASSPTGLVRPAYGGGAAPGRAPRTHDTFSASGKLRRVSAAIEASSTLLLRVARLESSTPR